MHALRSCALAALILSGPAIAQQAPPPVAGEPIVYDAAFYARFKPSTALDMINQTPGFALEDTSDRRGFAGASGNVLVDGEHPTAKSQTLSDILQRIPAAQVVRIELLRGSERGVDASNHAVIANVVRTRSAGQGVYQLGFEYAGRTPMPNGSGSWTGRFGSTDYSLGVNGYSLMRDLPGERKLLDGGGGATGTRRDTSPRTFYQLTVNAEASRPMLGGRMRATGQVFVSRYHEDAATATFSPAGVRTDFEADPYTERKRIAEVGLNYDRALGSWDLTLAGLATRTHFSSDITSTHSGGSGMVDSVFTQAVARDSGETVARATLVRSFGAHRVEAGGEIALNTLSQRLALALDLGGGPFPIAVPNSNLRIEERRAEAYLSHSWTSGSWSVETRLAGEASRLSFRGDTNQAIDLAYFKPSLQITRRLGKRNQVRARLYRDIGQLDFTDFVSVASLPDNRINGGNPDLKPETSWRAEIAGDLRFGREGAIGLTAFHHWVSDAADLIPVGPPGARADAPGNIGKASVDGVKLTLRLPLNALLSGASLNVDGTWQRSSVADPLTGRQRGISGFEDVAFKAEFRDDLPTHKIAWGATYTSQPTLTFYRLAEVERTRASPSLDLWIETTAIHKLKLRISALSLLDQPELRARAFYAPDRNGTLSGVEAGARHPGQRLMLTMSGAF